MDPDGLPPSHFVVDPETKLVVDRIWDYVATGLVPATHVHIIVRRGLGALRWDGPEKRKGADRLALKEASIYRGALGPMLGVSACRRERDVDYERAALGS